MGFSSSRFEHPSQKKSPWKIHPVWRGIGCLMVPLVLLISFLAANEVLNANFTKGWIYLPIELQGPSQYPFLFAKLAIAVVILLFIVVLLMLVYALVYRLVGPPRYGPYDAPPPRKRPARRK
jgi:uncharacterized membrane protein YhdT